MIIIDSFMMAVFSHWSLENHKNCLFRSKVKPTQKDKTYLNKDFYDLWIVLDKEDCYVITADCECKGG